MKRLIGIAMVVLLSAPSVMAQGEPCTADFECNGTVDADDVSEFLNQFGRSPFNNPCPDCYDSPCPCSTQGCDPPAPVPKTGQFSSYDTGDDGYLEKGVVWPIPRFTDNGDYTVTDNLTGLVWLKEANCFGRKTWHDALSDCNGLSSGSCGLTDTSIQGEWRLPNIKELESLIDYSRFGIVLPSGHPFYNVQTPFYWTSTTNEGFIDYAWYVDMRDGKVEYNPKDYEQYYIWCVRDPH